MLLINGTCWTHDSETILIKTFGGGSQTCQKIKFLIHQTVFYFAMENMCMGEFTKIYNFRLKCPTDQRSVKTAELHFEFLGIPHLPTFAAHMAT